jgi:hypothetical protein
MLGRVTADPPVRLSIRSESVALRRLRADRWRWRILLALLWAAGTVAMAWLGGSAVCMGPTLLLGGTAALIGREHGAPLVGVRVRGSRGTLAVDEAGIVVEIAGRRHRFARADVAGGWVETFRDREEAVIETRGGTLIRVAVEDPPGALAVLRAAGVAPDQRAVTLRLGVGETGGMRAVLVFLTMLLAPASLVLGTTAVALVFQHQAQAALICGLLAAFAAGSLFVLARPLVTTSLRIGTDGVVIQRLGRRTFVPRAALGAVTARADRVEIERRAGAPVVLRTSSRVEAAAVARRIREAAAASGAGDDGAALSRLDRQGRSVGEWLRQVRALAGERGGYREAALDPRALLDVVEDGGAPAERRIAAAVALAGADEGLRRRVAAAAGTCADARLGAALAAAGAGELDEADVEEAVRSRPEGRA